MAMQRMLLHDADLGQVVLMPGPKAEVDVSEPVPQHSIGCLDCGNSAELLKRGERCKHHSPPIRRHWLTGSTRGNGRFVQWANQSLRPPISRVRKKRASEARILKIPHWRRQSAV